jgi:hypothetical protein
LGAGASGAAGFAGADPPSWLAAPAGEPFAPSPDSALRASASSIVDAAALASMPAAFSAARSSLLETPLSFAIS